MVALRKCKIARFVLGNGHTGLKVAAGVGFVKGVLCMELLIGNSGSTPLTGFAIQCNKNAFGLAPKSTQVGRDFVTRHEIMLLFR